MNTKMEADDTNYDIVQSNLQSRLIKGLMLFVVKLVLHCRLIDGNVELQCILQTEMVQFANLNYRYALFNSCFVNGKCKHFYKLLVKKINKTTNMS
jgi:hypothetical protein